MDKLIEKLSLYISNTYQTKTNCSNEKKEELHFLLQYFIFNVAVLSTIIVINSMLGLFKECILVLLTFSVLRSSAGGFHCSSLQRCYMISNFYILLCSYLAHRFIHSSLPYLPLVVISVLSGFYIYFKYVPKKSEYDEGLFITKEQQKKRFFKTLLVLISLCGIGLFLCSKLLVVSISFGILSVAWITCDAGESIFNKIQQYL